MEKIRFNVSRKEDIEKGKYKVVTGDGRPVRIICWDWKNGDVPIIALADCGGCELIYPCRENGVPYGDDMTTPNCLWLIDNT